MSTATRSTTDRREEVEAMHAQLAEQVEALRSSQAWTAYLRFARSFHRYSLGNLLLILAQCPHAEHVAGYRAWQGKGRQVRKGERSIRIFAPRTITSTENDDDTGTEVEGKRVIFRPASVFDLSQTDPIPGAEDVAGYEPVAHLTGQDEAGIYAQVLAHLHSCAVTVTREQLDGTMNGYTAKDRDSGAVRVVIDSTLSPAQSAKTALHEAAHITLGHIDDDHAEYLAHRGRYEVEAESVAHVVAGLLGLDTSSYSTGYVAVWAERAETDVLKATAARVLTGVHALAEALKICE